MTDTLTSNAYWDAVRDHTYTWDGGAPQVGAPTDDPDWWKAAGSRRDLASRYAWTITAPATVAFVAHHAGPALVDPMAGTGWWAHLLTQAGVDVAASDLNPAGHPDNIWHRHGSLWHPVAATDGADAVRENGAGRTLLLSWPPYDTPDGANILTAYTGDRVIYIGEPAGCCGDDLHHMLGRDWTVVAEHRPVQWYGIHDHITVYDRKH